MRGEREGYLYHVRGFIGIFLTLVMLPVASGQLIQPANPDTARRRLHISIGGVPDSEKARITGIYPVDLDGFLTMWKVGKIDTKKKTKSELAKEIAAAYTKAKIYDRPVFQVISNGSSDRDTPVITIGGQVKKAGQYRWSKGETLGSAVTVAGGATAYGALRRVRLYRNGKGYTYNLELEKHRGVKIYPRDLIEVPQKSIFWKPAKK